MICSLEGSFQRRPNIDFSIRLFPIKYRFFIRRWFCAIAYRFLITDRPGRLVCCNCDKRRPPLVIGKWWTASLLLPIPDELCARGEMQIPWMPIYLLNQMPRMIPISKRDTFMIYSLDAKCRCMATAWKSHSVKGDLIILWTDLFAQQIQFDIENIKSSGYFTKNNITSLLIIVNWCII